MVRTIALWLLVALVGGWLAYALTQSPTFQTCLAEIPSDATANAFIENARVKTVCTGRFLFETRDAVLALATIAIALFTWTLYRATQRLWKAGERQLIASNRAWVFTQPWPHAIEFLSGGEIAVKKMELRVYGNSPATVYELYVDFSDKEPSGDDATYPRDPIRQVYNLAPSNQWWHRETFKTTDARPYIFGYVRYIDAFGEQRESRYCYRLIRLTDDIRFPFRTAGSAAWSRFT